MIVVRLIGGLGNQMFQYAAGRSLAHRNASLLKLDVSAFETYTLHRYGLHCFHVQEQLASREEVARFFPSPRGLGGSLRAGIRRLLDGAPAGPEPVLVRERSFAFDPSVLATRGDVALDGYWQSARYFEDVAPVLRAELSFRYPPSEENAALADVIAGTTSVSVHVRRGDYVSDAATSAVHGTCSPAYYRAAIAHVAERVGNLHLFVFSDDPGWVRREFEAPFPMTVVDVNGPDTNWEDLRLMSLCRHNVVANSSFSWWGAWLNRNREKIVVAPRRWYRDATRDVADLVPDAWTRVDG